MGLGGDQVPDGQPLRFHDPQHRPAIQVRQIEIDDGDRVRLCTRQLQSLRAGLGFIDLGQIGQRQPGPEVKPAVMVATGDQAPQWDRTAGCARRQGIGRRVERHVQVQ